MQGVGLNDPDEVCALLTKLGRAGEACLAVKHRTMLPEQATAAADVVSSGSTPASLGTKSPRSCVRSPLALEEAPPASATSRLPTP